MVKKKLAVLTTILALGTLFAVAPASPASAATTALCTGTGNHVNNRG